MVFPTPCIDDPPAEGGDCIRDGANSTRLYNVAQDPGELRELSASMPSKVAELRARLVELAKGMVVPQYPDNDPAADPALHLGAWTPWYLVKAKSDDELADSQLPGRADLYRTRHAPIITHVCGNCSGGSIMLSVLSFGARGDGVASNNVYEVYWDAGQPDCLEGRLGNCSDTRDAVDVTRLGLRGSDGHGRVCHSVPISTERAQRCIRSPLLLSTFGCIPALNDYTAHG